MEEARKTSEYTENSKCVWDELHKYLASCYSEHASKSDTITLYKYGLHLTLSLNVLVFVCYNKNVYFKSESTLVFATKNIFIEKPPSLFRR